MLKKLQAVLALFCMATFASAGTTVIGTASVRGNMRVDGSTVQGDATVFNGTVVETDNASANLRMGHGIDVTMSKSSKGTAYSDHFVLQRGESELSAPGSFQLEANGLRVAADSPNSVAVVTMAPNKTVNVAVLAGRFKVRDGDGLLLSNVLPGRPLSFAVEAPASTSPYYVSVVGLLDSVNGRYVLTTAEDVKYELTGIQIQKFVSDKVVVTGTFTPAAQGGEMAGTIVVKTIGLNPGGPASEKTKTGTWLIIGTALGGAGTVAWVVYDAEQPQASR